MVLTLVSQRFEQRVSGWFDSSSSIASPSFLELVIVLYVLGFLWEETRELFHLGPRGYLLNMWNFIDFSRNSLYVTTFALRLYSYLLDEGIPREKRTDYDPQLVAEGLFAAANVLSALKLVHLFSVNPSRYPWAV